MNVRWPFRGSVGTPCLIDGCRARPDQLSSVFLYSAPRYTPKVGYALRFDVGRDNRLTITRHSLLSGTTRSTSLGISLIEIQLTNGATRYHCMDTLELYLSFLRPIELCPHAMGGGRSTELAEAVPLAPRKRL
jgi:hypothetical protein